MDSVLGLNSNPITNLASLEENGVNMRIPWALFILIGNVGCESGKLKKTI